MLLIHKPKKIGHYQNYADLINSMFSDALQVNSIFKELKTFGVEKKVLVFLDLEWKYILLIPVLRALGYKVFYLCVSIEEFYTKKTKLSPRRITFELYKRHNILRIISILKNKKNNLSQFKCVSEFINDPQYFDLKYIFYDQSELKEIENNKEFQNDFIFILANTSNKYDIEKLKNLISKQQKFRFLIVSNKYKFETNKKVLHINRFITDKELLYLLKNAKYVYAANTTNRPSGLFGRAMQLNKPVIIFKDSYNDSFDYSNKFSIESIEDILGLPLNPNVTQFNSGIYDDYNSLKSILS